MHIKRPYFNQKLALYFDENCPPELVLYFSLGRWKKRLRISTAQESGHTGKSDSFHYSYCKQKGVVLITQDMDFNNDRRYPFTNGKMAGIIILRSRTSDKYKLIDLLERVLDFVFYLPFPKSFMLESKLIAANDVTIMRGRNARTRQVCEIHAKAGVTTIDEIRKTFDY